MPRLARLDSPGVLHHVIIRGIERRGIFRESKDQDDFLARFEDLIAKTRMSCYAWALLSNHAHFLLRTAHTPLATFMRRLLTGYAGSFNRRHKGYGPLLGLFCYWAVRELGYSMLEIAGRLGMSQPGVVYAVRRGERIANERAIKFIH